MENKVIEGDLKSSEAPDEAAMEGQVEVTGELAASEEPDRAAIDGTT